MTGLWHETQVGSQIVSKKYLHEYEDFEGFINRVSGVFSTPELQQQIKQAMYDADFFLAGRSLYAAGSEGKFRASYSNCYILPMPEDNIESIFDVGKQMARIFSYGGGCGVSISNLRPNGARVYNAARSSTGSCSFMDIYDAIGGVIGAQNRRAALMIGLDSWHPDIEDFLTIKMNNDKIQSANLSILFHDDFMEAVKNNQEYELKFTVKSTGEVISKTINAKDFFMKFAEANSDFAEPGSIFIDSVRKHNLLSGYPKEEYRIKISNPCSEYFGDDHNACTLGSINLYNLVVQPFTEDAHIDYIKFAELVELGITALDEVLDIGYDSQPLEANRDAIDDWRAIGLGIFGLSDMFIALGVRYGSPESLKIVDELMKCMLSNAVITSANLAKSKGTFGKYNWDYIKQSPLLKQLSEYEYNLVKQHGLRNGSLLSIAPTGSISTMCGISGGLEPLFAVSYDRTTHALEKTGQKFKVYAKSVEHYCRVNSRDAHMDLDFGILPNYIVTTHDINPFERVKLQATIQKYIDNAISSTVNLKYDATVQQVFDTYVYAWESGCKGLTIFRDGCKRNAILTTSDKSSKPEQNLRKLNSISPIKRGNIKRINGSTIVGHTACSPKLYTTVNVKDGDVFEVFTNVTNGCKSNISTITKLVSLALRSGVKVDEIVSELKSGQCPACGVLKQQGKSNISSSCGACIGEAIELVYGSTQEEPTGLLKCPSCGEPTLRPEGKCFNCSNCGYSKCD